MGGRCEVLEEDSFLVAIIGNDIGSLSRGLHQKDMELSWAQVYRYGHVPAVPTIRDCS